MSVAARARRPRAPPFLDPPGYARHRPEATLLYQLVEQHYPALRELRVESGRPLPDHVDQEFEAYLKCGRLEHVFLRVRCEQCHAEKLVAFSCKERGLCPSCGARRMAETAALLADEVLPERPLRQWVLLLPHALRFLLATNPAAITQVLGVDIAASEREKLERLCRYVSRPPVAEERLALTPTGHVRYALKTPYRDGTTHVRVEAVDFIARLAALVPPQPNRLERPLGARAPPGLARLL